MKGNFQLTLKFLMFFVVVINTSCGQAMEHGPHGKFVPKICSRINFNDVSWPEDLNHSEKEALILALNISGSFEGSDSWSNIANNFDRQGISLGLLNQNLGQGTLQPLLVEAKNTDPVVFRSIFSPAHLQSLSEMLAQWQLGNDFSRMLFRGFIFMKEPTLKDKETVLWAQRNLYDKNGKFLPAWKNEFMTLASSKNYIDIQLRSSVEYHYAATAYLKLLQLSQVRSYLTMFDIVVQNGGLKEENIPEYNEWLRANPWANETQKLEKIVLIRKEFVGERWKDIYMLRKSSLINRKGVINKIPRNFESEYCFDGFETVDLN